jgi:Spy/CpxP family protein refolding chaperone
MRLSKWAVNITLFGTLALASLATFAANQQCGLSQSCSNQAQLSSQKFVQQKSSLGNTADTLGYYLEKLELTPEQIVQLRKVQESQVPLILLSKRHLEQAHAKLRAMAMKNVYDQQLADQLAQTIASHTANLAVLQAQREYEIFSMLSEEQVARYETLEAQIP